MCPSNQQRRKRENAEGTPRFRLFEIHHTIYRKEMTDQTDGKRPSRIATYGGKFQLKSSASVGFKLIEFANNMRAIE
jgi:hypothetical protein